MIRNEYNIDDIEVEEMSS